MLTLKRFAALAASYGADLRRWPEDIQDEADAFLAASPEARALLEEARALDGVLSGEAEWLPDDQDAALVRLRLGVEARIAGATRPARVQRQSRMLDLRWLGMATGSGLAVAAGLALGVIDLPATSPDIVQIILQPSPIGILVE